MDPEPIAMPPVSRAQARSLFVLLAALLLCTPLAIAQRNYKQDPFDKSLRSKGALAKGYVRSGGGDPAAKQQFEEYIEKYHLPAMTRWQSEDPTRKAPLEDLGTLRVRLFRDFLDVARGPTHQYLTQQAYQFARRVFGSASYHPSVRYNAILILSQLNQKPVGDGETPTPLPNANRLLAAVLEKGVTDPRRPRYEMAGALVGLERHAGVLPREQLGQTVRALQAMLEADELPGQYAKGVKDYLYVQAARTLATALSKVGSPGRDGVYVKAIAKRIADDSLDLETRAAIASQLDRIGLKPKQFDASGVALAVSDLAVAVTEREKEYAEKFEEIMRLGGVGRRSQSSGRDKFESRVEIDPLKGETKLVLDGIVTILNDTSAAASALEKILDGEDAASMKTIAEAIRNAETVALDEDSVDLDITDAIKKAATAVSEAALTPPEPAEEAAPEEAAEAAAEPAAAVDGQ